MDMSDLYRSCRLCPRACGVDRLIDNKGLCGESSELRLAFAGLHRGEEPPLSGSGGSGTVFVSGCNLGCVFCQNWQISRPRLGAPSQKVSSIGKAVSAGEFTAICLTLQDKGAENINIVSGSHAVPVIAEYLSAAKNAGLRIPVLWNSSSYESLQTLELLGGHIDTYMPDLKFMDSALAERLCNAPDYPQTATRAIQWMMRQRPGHVLVRHLILPGCLESTREVLRWFADNTRGAAQLSLMSQYTPVTTDAQSAPGRFLSEQEYETVLGWLEEFGIEDGFCQELVCGSDWLPDFTRPNPFSSDLSVPVWHCMDSSTIC